MCVNLIIIVEVKIIRNVESWSLSWSQFLCISKILPKIGRARGILEGEWVLLGDLLNLLHFNASSKVVDLLLRTLLVSLFLISLYAAAIYVIFHHFQVNVIH